MRRKPVIRVTSGRDVGSAFCDNSTCLRAGPSASVACRYGVILLRGSVLCPRPGSCVLVVGGVMPVALLLMTEGVSAVKDERLRPLERRLLRLADEGIDEIELARRFRRSPDHIRRVLDLARLPGRRAPTERERLRPLERRLLRWRQQGASWSELADRFRRSTPGLAQVERLARYKQGH